MRNNKLLIVLLPFILCSSTGCDSSPKEETPESIFVTFKDYDDSVLFHEKIPYGTKASYIGETPQRDMTIDTVYTFSGWDKSLDQPLYANTVFNAEYTEETRKYVVTFNNYDGTLLQRINVDYGKTAMYTEYCPIKASTDEHIEYAFSGWDKDVNTYKIYSDTVFTAQFSMKEYVFATFNNYDGKQLQRSKVVKGKDAAYTGSKPTRDYSGTDKAYKFTGWDKPLTNMTDDTTFTAKFELLNIYTVTFKNYDGGILQKVKVIHGEDAEYTGRTPYKASESSGDYKYTYTFSGWSSPITNITSNLTVTAVFTKETATTGATAIREHLDQHGSGSYHNVTTSSSSNSNSTLGYNGSLFYMGYTNTSDLESYMAVSCFYGASAGSGLFELYDSGNLTFSASYNVDFSGHSCGNVSLKKINKCNYTSDKDISSIAALSIVAARVAVNNANKYCSNEGLPYVF